MRTELWIRRLSVGFVLIAVLLGAAQAWTSRLAMNPDGIEYLDNATAWWSGDFHNALNSLWSPLYPWLIGALFALARPAAFSEFPLAHLLNFLIYLVSLAAFLFFIGCVRAMLPSPRRASAVTLSLLLVAYSSFVYCSLDFTTLAYVTPDLLVSLFTFLAAGLFLRIAAGTASTSHYAVLGAVLGFGYLAKSPFLLFGLVCLGMVAVLVRHRPAGLAKIALAAIAFAAVITPYVWMLSSSKGRLTFGESGRSNIIWHVNGVPLYHWQGSPKNGQPIHPTRQLSSQPAIFEFATPVAGTYPPGYDPVYWIEGARIALRPADFARSLVEQLKLYGYLIHHRQLALVFALLAFVLLAANNRSVFGSIGRFWPVICLSFIPFAMYALVHAEGRYLAPFFVLLWTALFAGILNSLAGNVDSKVMVSITAIAAALMLGEALNVVKPATPIGAHYQVARALQDLGLKQGDAAAIVTRDFDFFWARLTGARITMQVDFVDASCPDCRERQSEWEKAKPILAAHGVIFVVSPCVPGVVDQPGWRQLGSTGVYAYHL